MAAKLALYAALWACAFGAALVLGWLPKLIGDSGSLWALLTQTVPRQWLLNTFALTFTGRYLALYLLFGLVFGVLHLLLCAWFEDWKAFKLPRRHWSLLAGAALGLPLGGLYLLYAHYSPFQNGWGALLIVLTFLGCGSLFGLLGADSPRLQPQTDAP